MERSLKYGHRRKAGDAFGMGFGMEENRCFRRGAAIIVVEHAAGQISQSRKAEIDGCQGHTLVFAMIVE